MINTTFSIVQYSSEYEEKWDAFIKNESINGTFLQSRRFLNYHPDDRFNDHSLIVFNGSSICAVIPGCDIIENGKKIFYSHKGSTFGGIVFSRTCYSTKDVKNIVDILDAYLKEQEYNTIIFKNTSPLFSEENMELLDYFLLNDNYSPEYELSFYIDCSNLADEVSLSFNRRKRRDYNYSLKNNLEFRELKSEEEILAFYHILEDNLQKFQKKPVHTYDELLDLWKNRIPDVVIFYGTFCSDILIAGSMVFKFKKSVFHTQYLASDSQYLSMYPMNHLCAKLIETARNLGYHFMSFGISTEEHGKILNEGLATFKEGFGAKYCINKTYTKEILQ